MKELTEPEVSEEILEAQSFLTMWKSVTSRPMTTREVDFAKIVRRQAYEDGLRDAGKDAERFEWIASKHRVMSLNIDGKHAWVPHGIEVQRLVGPTFREAVDAAMLTASQKEEK